jgi:hypothetical protein
MEICMGKQYSARNSGILQPFDKKHVSLNNPHRVEAFDTLTIDIAIASSLRHRTENLGVRKRYYYCVLAPDRLKAGSEYDATQCVALRCLRVDACENATQR